MFNVKPRFLSKISNALTVDLLAKLILELCHAKNVINVKYATVLDVINATVIDVIYATVIDVIYATLIDVIQ